MGTARGMQGSARRTYIVLVRNVAKRNHLEDLGVDGSVTFKWTFKKQGGHKQELSGSG